MQSVDNSLTSPSTNCGERSEDGHFLVAVEVKTLTKASTQIPAREFSNNFGEVVDIDIASMDQREKYVRVTLKQEYRSEYRSQCLHHAASLGVRCSFSCCRTLEHNICCKAKVHYQSYTVVYGVPHGCARFFFFLRWKTCSGPPG